jgi:limonene-1,2-epoxide hydrolase
MSEKYKILRQVIDAWTARDIDGVLGHLADDIVWHYAAAIAPPLKGKASARKLLEKMAGEANDLHWRIYDYAERGDRLFIEGAEDYLTPDGVRVATAYAGVLEFRDGLIFAWRDYLDVGTIEAQKAGKPTPSWIAALMDRPSAEA